MKTKLDRRPFDVPVIRTARAVGGRWKLVILWRLLEGPKRFNELKRLVPGITQRALSRALREMTRDGLILREERNSAPPEVHYSLTEKGRSLEKALLLLSEWGTEFSARDHKIPGWLTLPSN